LQELCDGVPAGVGGQGAPIGGLRDKDVIRLSSFGYEHINMLGRYAFMLPEMVARGELRPLRDPRSAGDHPDEPTLT
jgi:hypothetical protein